MLRTLRECRPLLSMSSSGLLRVLAFIFFLRNPFSLSFSFTFIQPGFRKIKLLGFLWLHWTGLDLSLGILYNVVRSLVCLVYGCSNEGWWRCALMGSKEISTS